MDARGVRLAGGGGCGVGVGRGGAGGGAQSGFPGAAGFRQHRASCRPQRCGGGVAARWEGADRRRLRWQQLPAERGAVRSLHERVHRPGGLWQQRAADRPCGCGGGVVVRWEGADRRRRRSGGILQSAELFDPSTNTFTALAASGNTELQTARTGAVAAALPGGRVLIAGGSTAAAICRARSCSIRPRTRSRRCRRRQQRAADRPRGCGGGLAARGAGADRGRA